MKIERISIFGLFGRFDHILSIPSNKKSPTAIITAPNGYGKTAMLRALNAFFNRDWLFFVTTAFTKIQIDFAKGKSVVLTKDLKDLEPTFDRTANVKIQSIGFGCDGELHDIQINTSSFDFRRLARSHGLEEIERDTWIDDASDRVMNTVDVLRKYGSSLQRSNIIIFGKTPDWLDSLTQLCSVKLVETQRLLSIKVREHSRHRALDEIEEASSVVEEDARDLATKINQAVGAYAQQSQKLDQSFPSRIINLEPTDNIDKESIENRLQNLKAKRESLASFGFIDEDPADVIDADLLSVKPEIEQIINIYIEDTEKKLTVFDELLAKVSLFKNILDAKFDFKQININSQAGIELVDKKSGKQIPLSDLSSGEQHELVLMYELLFKTEPGALVLIDEPELSLHVSWQIQFMENIEQIQKLEDIHVIIATHSPQIINDKWELVQELAAR